MTVLASIEKRGHLEDPVYEEYVLDNGVEQTTKTKDGIIVRRGFSVKTFNSQLPTKITSHHIYQLRTFCRISWRRLQYCDEIFKGKLVNACHKLHAEFRKHFSNNCKLVTYQLEKSGAHRTGGIYIPLLEDIQKYLNLEMLETLIIETSKRISVACATGTDMYCRERILVDRERHTIYLRTVIELTDDGTYITKDNKNHTEYEPKKKGWILYTWRFIDVPKALEFVNHHPYMLLLIKDMKAALEATLGNEFRNEQKRVKEHWVTSDIPKSMFHRLQPIILPHWLNDGTEEQWSVKTCFALTLGKDMDSQNNSMDDAKLISPFLMKLRHDDYFIPFMQTRFYPSVNLSGEFLLCVDVVEDLLQGKSIGEIFNAYGLRPFKPKDIFIVSQKIIDLLHGRLSDGRLCMKILYSYTTRLMKVVYRNIFCSFLFISFLLIITLYFSGGKAPKKLLEFNKFLQHEVPKISEASTKQVDYIVDIDGPTFDDLLHDRNTLFEHLDQHRKLFISFSDEPDPRMAVLNKFLALIILFFNTMAAFWDLNSSPGVGEIVNDIKGKKKKSVCKIEPLDRNSLVYVSRSISRYADILCVLSAALCRIDIDETMQCSQSQVGFPHYMALKCILVAQQFITNCQLYRYSLQTQENLNKLLKQIYEYLTNHGLGKQARDLIEYFKSLDKDKEQTDNQTALLIQIMVPLINICLTPQQALSNNTKNQQSTLEKICGFRFPVLQRNVVEGDAIPSSKLIASDKQKSGFKYMDVALVTVTQLCPVDFKRYWTSLRCFAMNTALALTETRFSKENPIPLIYPVLENNKLSFNQFLDLMSGAGCVFGDDQLQGLKFLFRFVYCPCDPLNSQMKLSLLLMACGVGKTLVALMFAKYLLCKTHQIIKSIIWVCPCTLLEQTKEELIGWEDDLNLEDTLHYELEAKSSKYDTLKKCSCLKERGGILFITPTYFAAMLSNEKIGPMLIGIMKNDCLLIIDELHQLKSKQMKKFKSLNCPFKLGLTATPFNTTFEHFKSVVSVILDSENDAGERISDFNLGATPKYLAAFESRYTDVKQMHPLKEEEKLQLDWYLDSVHAKLLKYAYICSQRPVIEFNDLTIVDMVIHFKLSEEDRYILESLQSECSDKGKLQNATRKFYYGARLMLERADKKIVEPQTISKNSTTSSSGSTSSSSSSSSSMSTSNSKTRSDIFPFPKTKKLIEERSEDHNNGWKIINCMFSRAILQNQKLIFLSASAQGIEHRHGLLSSQKIQKATGGATGDSPAAINRFKNAKTGVLMTTNDTGGIGGNHSDVKHVVLYSQSFIQSDIIQALNRAIRKTCPKGTTVYIYRVYMHGAQYTEKCNRYYGWREYFNQRLIYGNKNYHVDTYLNAYKHNAEKNPISGNKVAKLSKSNLYHHLHKMCKGIIHSAFIQPYVFAESSSLECVKGFDSRPIVEQMKHYGGQLNINK